MAFEGGMKNVRARRGRNYHGERQRHCQQRLVRASFLPPLESPPVTSSYVFYIVIIATPFLHHRRSLVEREERFRDYALSSNYQ